MATILFYLLRIKVKKKGFAASRRQVLLKLVLSSDGNCCAEINPVSQKRVIHTVEVYALRQKMNIYLFHIIGMVMLPIEISRSLHLAKPHRAIIN